MTNLRENKKGDRTEALIHSFPLRFAVSIAAIIIFEFAFDITVKIVFHKQLTELQQSLLDALTLGALFAVFNWCLILKPLLFALRSDRALLIHKQRELESEVDKHKLNKKLAKAFEMAETEANIIRVFKRAVEKYLPDLPIELLLADSSQAHMRLAASTAAPYSEGAAGLDCHAGDGDGFASDTEANILMCNVATPSDCPAARYASIQVNKDSGELDACPVLVERTENSICALCVPINIAGKSVGVIHGDFQKDSVNISNTLAIFSLIATHFGNRLGLVRALNTARQGALTDPLTGLLNRRSFEDRCDALLRDGRTLSLVEADVDHFKKLNDTYGHAVGDKCLKAFSNILMKCCRNGDIVARLGGEEFCIVLLDMPSENAIDLLERIRQKLPVSLAEAGLPEFTASFGVSDTKLGDSVDALLKISDHAMYKAKQSGRDQIVIGSPQFREYSVS